MICAELILFGLITHSFPKHSENISNFCNYLVLLPCQIYLKPEVFFLEHKPWNKEFMQVKNVRPANSLRVFKKVSLW